MRHKINWKYKSILLLGLCLIASVLVASSPLKYAEDRLPSSLNPMFADDMYSVRMTELLFERLIGWSKENKPTPMLATSWQMSTDKKVIAFTLRQGVLWHDGKPFTAKDVVFTIKSMTSKRSQIEDRYLVEIVKHVEALNDHKVKITFKKSLDKPLKWLRFHIIPKHAFRRAPSRADRFNQKPIGTGAFEYSRWIDKKIQLKRFKQHWRKKTPQISGVTLQALADKNLQVEVLRYGGIDGIVRVRPKDITVLERDTNIRLHDYSTNDWWYIAFNHRRSLFQDKRVREAFVYALDRDLLRSSRLGSGNTISGPFSPNDPLYNFNVLPRKKDLAKAKERFDQAGWKMAGKWRKKGTSTLSVRMLLPKSKSSYRTLCLSIQSELRKVGVKVELKWLPDAVWKRTVFRKKDFDLALHIWNFDELASIAPLFHSKGSHNYIGYKNSRVDTLFDKAKKTIDPVVYQSMYRQIHVILNQELPYLFLWSLDNYSAMVKRIVNVQIHPFNYFHHLYSWRKKEQAE